MKNPLQWAKTEELPKPKLKAKRQLTFPSLRPKPKSATAPKPTQYCLICGAPDIALYNGFFVASQKSF